ncbi:hypothetical protein SJ05684_c31810 [Sinorhizobium sojae CCBAU 05684]|uniref:Uncharacterized protein n=1 Tax=Sinorhizobium sojae CCBAU 05684 TaxID=716928 RepID=A0A249PG02_9HYPH|nr:hypothetical protein SJ05684_c31810 [Sinorhizobium sojae CCBAU 05684]
MSARAIERLNKSAIEVLWNETLRLIAHELLEQRRQNNRLA